MANTLSRVAGYHGTLFLNNLKQHHEALTIKNN
jgi:hypothetical protein